LFKLVVTFKPTFHAVEGNISKNSMNHEEKHVFINAKAAALSHQQLVSQMTLDCFVETNDVF